MAVGDLAFYYTLYLWAWPKACGVQCSIKFSLNHFLWTLYVNTAFLRCVASGYCDERAGIKIYCTVLSKYWTVWFKSYSILKMSGIDGSFILYNNNRSLMKFIYNWSINLFLFLFLIASFRFKWDLIHLTAHNWQKWKSTSLHITAIKLIG